MSEVRWQDIGSDPNHPELLARRRRLLSTARAPSVPDRNSWLERRVAGRDVLDLGCVDHLGPRFQAAPLHRALARSARRLVGVDVSVDGVKGLCGEGFDVRWADVTKPGLRDVVGTNFSTVVAGELVEHLLDLTVFFANVRSVLRPDGELIMSTPNPQSLVLATYNALGRPIDNVDHVSYLWPAGMVEIAARTGFRLEEFRGERRLGRRRQLPLYALARAVELLFPASLAASKSAIYVFKVAG